MSHLNRSNCNRVGIVGVVARDVVITNAEAGTHIAAAAIAAAADFVVVVAVVGAQLW